MSKMNCNNDDIGSDCQWWNDGICEHSETCGEPLKTGEHTKLPWRHSVLPGVWDCIQSINGDRIARLCNNNAANAEYIVLACNSHKDLVTACKAMVTDFDLGEHCVKHSLAMMRAAIEKACPNG